ncbi:MAG: transposase [Cyanobacteria bacterium DS2.3.42]|nr:transposase [Cyanobacteria bacterium DS2.3.42]
MSMQDFRRMAAAMDQRARQLMAEGVMGPELIHRMVGHMPELQRIWVGANDQQLAMLCQDYPGFYEYASLMEEAAEAQRANPGQSRYKDLPELDEPLKGKLSDLLTDAAVLERQYQALIGAGARKGDANIDELSRMHQKWLSNRDRFIESVKESDLPKNVSEFVVPTLGQMADRIAQLKIRAGGK